MCASKRINANLNATRMAVTPSLPHPYPYMYTYINNIYTLLNPHKLPMIRRQLHVLTRTRASRDTRELNSTQLTAQLYYGVGYKLWTRVYVVLCCVRGVCVNPYCKVIGNLNGQIIHHVYDCCAFVGGDGRPKRNHKRCDAHK